AVSQDDCRGICRNLSRKVLAAELVFSSQPEVACHSFWRSVRRQRRIRQEDFTFEARWEVEHLLSCKRADQQQVGPRVQRVELPCQISLVVRVAEEENRIRVSLTQL